MIIAMRPKIILTLFLLLGSLAGLVAVGCGTERSDSLMRAEWLYVNNSGHKIEIVSENREPLVLQPQGEYLYEVDGLVDGGSDLTPEDYDTPFWWGCTIIVDEQTEYIFTKGEGIAAVKNYDAQKIGTNHYKFTCIFTDEMIEKW